MDVVQYVNFNKHL